MQTLMVAVCTAGRSLRDKIGDDTAALSKFGLWVEREKQAGRPRGWTKLLSEDKYGAVNVSWDASSFVLSCRIVNRGTRPGPIAGALAGYLMSRHSRRIVSLTIYPR
jgi:hypothetical protein